MSAKEIQRLQDILDSGEQLAFIHTATKQFSPVMRIVHGAVACPEEPEVDKCAMLRGGSYISLFDADIEDFVKFSNLT